MSDLADKERFLKTASADLVAYPLSLAKLA